MGCCAIGFIVTLTLSLLTAPLVAEAQPAGKIPRIGVLRPGPAIPGGVFDAFRQGLRDLGYVEGQTIVIEERGPEGKEERLPELAAELVRLQVEVIVTSGPTTARAVQHATSTIPIVVAVMHEPVALGFIASFARPGGNITGLAFQDAELSTKRLELLKEAVPELARLAVLWHPPGGGVSQLRATEEAARALGLQLQVLEVQRLEDFDRAFAAATQEGAHALLQLASPFFPGHRKTLIDLAVQRRLPMTCESKLWVVEGCLMTYGPSFTAMARRAASYVDRILKGAKPAELPVEQPMQFELIINLKTAKALGLTISSTLLFQADEVIQ